MYNRKKERIYITDLIQDPPITYPMYYTVSSSLKNNDIFLDTLKAIHLSDFSNYKTPKSSSYIFEVFSYGAFAIYKEQYIVGYFGGKLMYLESAGWKSLSVTEDIFDMDQWLV